MSASMPIRPAKQVYFGWTVDLFRSVLPLVSSAPGVGPAFNTGHAVTASGDHKALKLERPCSIPEIGSWLNPRYRVSLYFGSSSQR